MSNEFAELQDKAENTFTKINSEQEEINRQLKAIEQSKPDKKYTKEDVTKYNALVKRFNDLKTSKEQYKEDFENNFAAINARKEIFEGDYNINLTKNILYNNFTLTNQVEKYREQFSGEGFWNGAADIIGGEVIGGLYSTFKKAAVGLPTVAFTAYLDLFDEENNYSRADGFRDLVTNFTNYSLLPKSEAEKFSITEEEGGLKEDASLRSYLKLGGSMVPFTGYLISEARKGNVTGVRQSLGKFLQGAKGSAKVLTPLSKSLKNEVIMADAAFRATILDNAKDARDKGLDGIQADVYATTISLN